MKRLLTLGFRTVVAFFLLGSVVLLTPAVVFGVQRPQGPVLAVVVGPATVPADSGEYPFVVHLKFPNNSLVFAPQDVRVRVFSSRPEILDVSTAELVIRAGSTFALGTFRSSAQPGSADLTAQASGYVPGGATVKTAGPAGRSAKLAVFPAPEKILPEAGATSFVFVQLQDAAGFPALASTAIHVALTSSDERVGAVDPSVTIAAGSSSARAVFNGTFQAGSTVITATAPGFLAGEAKIQSIGPSPAKLTLYAAPDVIPGDNRSNSLVAVQLQDKDGKPVRAPQDLPVALSSSDLTVGTLQGNVTIPAGQHFALAQFLGRAVGRTTITAAASGVESHTIDIQTKPLGPRATALRVHLVPENVLPNRGQYPGLVVSLMNATGFPVRTNLDVLVTLRSSRTDVGTVEDTVRIPAGQFSAVSNLSSTFLAGDTEVTASAPGFVSAQWTVKSSGPIPKQLSVISAPARLHANSVTYSGIVVQLQDEKGNPANAPIDILADLSSSDLEVATVSPNVLIPAGRTFEVAGVTTTDILGTANINAFASGYESASFGLVTTEVRPSKLALFAVPPILQATGESTPALVVQLQNAAGVPAKAGTDIPLFLTSSVPSAGSPPSQAVLPSGSSFVFVPFTSTGLAGSTTVSVAGEGYSRATVDVRTVVFTMDVALRSSPTSIVAGRNATLTVKVSSAGVPLAGAQLNWTTNLGSIRSTSRTTNATGDAQADFTADRAGTAVIRLNVTKGGFQLKAPANMTITVAPRPESVQTTGSPFSQPLFLAGIAGAGALAAGVGVILIRRRRRAPPESFL